MAKDKPELIDSPKELLELIDSCLKPKQKEKQEKKAYVSKYVFACFYFINDFFPDSFHSCRLCGKLYRYIYEW